MGVEGDLDGLGWYWISGMGKLQKVWGAWGGPRTLCTHPKPFTSISGPLHSSQVLHTHPWPPHFSLAIYKHPRPSTPVSGPPYLPITLYTHPRRSIPTLDVSDHFKYPLTHPRPSTHMSIHTIDVLNTLRRLWSIPTHPMPSIHTKAFNTHPRPFTHILRPLHPSQALYTQPKLFIIISGPPYPSLAPTLLLGSPHPPKTL